MTRDGAIAGARAYFDSGGFAADLRRRVAYRTESGVARRRADTRAYLREELLPAAARPDEHLLGCLARDALALMTGLFWDLGTTPTLS